MISLVSALAVGNGAKTALSSSTSGVKAAVRRMRLAGISDHTWLDIGLSPDGDDADFSVVEVEDIHAFLASARVAPILSVVVQVLMLGDMTHESLNDVRSLFIEEAKVWTIERKSKWYKRAAGIWERVNAIYSETLPSANDDLGAEIAEYASFVRSPLELSVSKASSLGAYLDRMTSLCVDLDRLVRAVGSAQELIGQIAAVVHEPMITYRPTDERTEFYSLFVPRTVVDFESEESEGSDALVASGSPFRIVLTGPPGAGKTTLVRHIVAANADQAARNPPIGTIVVKCKDYVARGWQDPVIEHATAKVAAEYGLDMSRTLLEDVFLIGRAVMIFDGLDEVTELSRRSEMVSRIHSFAARYPAISILVTSRETGYHRAPMSSSVFRRMRLEEFNEEQTETYCTKWFAGFGRPDLVKVFMLQSQTVADLRRNPLLLSLLCMLYRDSGTIPSNRRQIYQQCADLLFHRWDAHRQIAQNVSMPNYGDRLMQEIARWFYASPTAQGNGLEERQIAKVAGGYMISSLGFQAELAEPAARDFLDFCADRAWLLGSVGTNSRGDRLFQFIHRTFYEYFASEAMARASGGVSEVAAKITEAYSKDSTSVVRELLIQAYDQFHERGAADVFERLCRDGIDDDLIIRLIDSSILTQYARKPGFQLLLARWDGSVKARWPSAAQFSALLALNALARQHFVDDFLVASARARDVFMRGWASLQLTGFGDVHEAVWGPVVKTLTERHCGEFVDIRSPAVANWLAASSLSFNVLGNVWEHVVFEGVYGWTPGALWWALDALFVRGFELQRNEARDELTASLIGRLNRGTIVPRDVVSRLRQALDELHLELVVWTPVLSNSDVPHERSRVLLAYLLLALFEEIPHQGLCWSHRTLRGLAASRS